MGEKIGSSRVTLAEKEFSSLSIEDLIYLYVKLVDIHDKLSDFPEALYVEKFSFYKKILLEVEKHITYRLGTFKNGSSTVGFKQFNKSSNVKN